MRNTKQCLIRYTNTLLCISWNWTVTNDILFTRHSGVINAVRQMLCKQSTCSCYNIVFFYILLLQFSLPPIISKYQHACAQYTYPLSALIVVHCMILVLKVSETAKNHLKQYELYFFFFFRILLFCWKKNLLVG